MKWVLALLLALKLQPWYDCSQGASKLFKKYLLSHLISDIRSDG